MRFRALDSMYYERRERGFALVTAMIAAVIMLALGILVIQLSTQDLKSGSATVGEKKALTAADTGVHKLMQNFDPQVTLDGVTDDVVIDETNAPGDRYIYGTADPSPNKGPSSVPLPGYSIENGGMGLKRYDVDVTGKNVNYKTEVTIGIGVGNGPNPLGTDYE